MTPVTRLKNYVRLLSVLTAAVTMTVALYFMACASSRDQAREATVEQETAEGESATTITRKQVTLSPVPAAVASLRLAAASLPDLPPGLPITTRRGPGAAIRRQHHHNGYMRLPGAPDRDRRGAAVADDPAGGDV